MRQKGGKFQCQKTKLSKKKEILEMLMTEKKRDNLKHEKKVRKRRNQTLGKIEDTLGRNSRSCRKLRNQARKHFKELRMCLRKKNDKKITFLCKKYDMRGIR